MVVSFNLRLAMVIGAACLALCTTCPQPASAAFNTDDHNQAVSVYREPSSWFFHLIREFFDDIDWQAIAKARDQIEKFIRKVDRIWSSVKGSQNNGKYSASGAQEAGGEPTATNSTHSTSSRWDTGRLFANSWWSKFTAGGSKAGSSPNDPTNLKEMLERVACFVGYVRLMNLSNEALAELDASKAITNLFAGSTKTSSASYLASLFG